MTNLREWLSLPVTRTLPEPSEYFPYQALLVAGIGWFLAYGIFLLIYGPMLLGTKRTG